MEDLLQTYAYKELKYRYWGRDYYFSSSQELFSASQIDRGSQLLLKSLLPNASPLEKLIPQSHFDIWDWGCGIGVLGIMVQAYLSRIHKEDSSTLHIWDRDALALGFAQANWQANRNLALKEEEKSQVELRVHSKLWGEEAEPPKEGPFLVLANIPAKLGEPVLRHLIPRLASASYTAIVIVAPLRHLVEECPEIEILHRSGSGDHAIFHYRAKTSKELPEALELYKRGESSFYLQGKTLTSSKPKKGKISHWDFCSAYGLSDFDEPSFGLQLQIRLLAQRNWSGRVLLWEPGHGHLACFLAIKQNSSRVSHIDLAGRDRLALLFSQHNLQNSAGPKTSTRLLSLPCLEAVENEGDLIVLGKFSPSQALCNWLARLKNPKTWLCLQGKNHKVRQLKLGSGWVCVEELRDRGLLAQLWQKI